MKIKTKIDGRTSWYVATTDGRIVTGSRGRAAEFTPELGEKVLRHLKDQAPDRFPAEHAELVPS